jgi:hypothetical protein
VFVLMKSLRGGLRTIPHASFELKFKFRSLANVLTYISTEIEARGSVAVEALCYKPEGRGFESR